MVQFKLNKSGVIEDPCGVCKSYDGGFCYKWSFPITEGHVPCTKFRRNDKTHSEPVKNNSIPRELIKKFLTDLKDFKGKIIGQSFDEIYIGLDNLIEGYTRRFNVDL